ncbi:MAG TPA: methyltransferase domain-containing protein [Pseudobdellovibrionaceae bacterium]|jgi:ubiquinone/menaquinone biosynthesis C-methylase UbiE
MNAKVKAKELYSNWDLLGVILSNWRTDLVIKHLPEGTFLDLACGDNRLVKKLGRGIGIDISNYGGSADMVLPDFSKLPFEKNSINAVTVLAAFNYFDQPVSVLKEIRRVLSDDGCLIITQLDHRISKAWHQLRDRGLVRTAYSDQQLQEMFTAADLRIDVKERFMLGLNKVFVVRKKLKV